MQFVLVSRTHLVCFQIAPKSQTAHIGMLRNCSKFIVKNREESSEIESKDRAMRPNRKLFRSSCTLQ